MNSTSLDLSASTDLGWVADLARPVINAAAGARIFNVAAIRAVLEPEIDPDGPLRLVGDLGCDTERALRLLRGLAEGLQMSARMTTAT